MRLLVVGAGATGGYFGGRLAQAGRDVAFLVRAGRAAQLREHGLQIVSPHGDATLAPNVVEAGTIDGTYDAVLVTVKAYSLPQAMDDVSPAVGRATMIVPVLNGMKHIDDLAARFGAAAVIGGVCRVSAMLDEQGRIVQIAPFQDMSYGEMDGSASARTEALDAFMRGAGFTARLTPEIAREMWEKWVLLAAMGAATCLMRGTVGEIEAVPGGTEFVLGLLDEVLAVVNAVGVRPSDAAVATTRGMLTAKGSPLASSMYRDLQKGGRVEADHIIGDLRARGRAAGIATPLLAAAYAHLSVYQRRIAG